MATNQVTCDSSIKTFQQEPMPSVKGDVFKYSIETQDHDYQLSFTKKLSNEEVAQLKLLIIDKFEKNTNSEAYSQFTKNKGVQLFTQSSTRYNQMSFSEWFKGLEADYSEIRETKLIYLELIKSLVNKRLDAGEEALISGLATLVDQGENAGNISFTQTAMVLAERFTALDLFLKKTSSSQQFTPSQIDACQKFLDCMKLHLMEVTPSELFTYQDLAKSFNVSISFESEQPNFSGETLPTRLIQLCHELEIKLLRSESAISQPFAKELSTALAKLPVEVVELEAYRGQLTSALKEQGLSLKESTTVMKSRKQYGGTKISELSPNATYDKYKDSVIYLSANITPNQIWKLAVQSKASGGLMIVQIGITGEGLSEQFSAKYPNEDEELETDSFELKFQTYTPRYDSDKVTLYCFNTPEATLNRVLLSLPETHLPLDAGTPSFYP